MQLLDQFPDRTGRPAEDGQGTIGYGACTRCGCNRLERHVGVVDIDVQFYAEGCVILCADCAAEVGALVGMIPAEKAAELQGELDTTSDALVEALAQIEEWRPFVESAKQLLTTGATGSVQG